VFGGGEKQGEQYQRLLLAAINEAASGENALLLLGGQGNVASGYRCRSAEHRNGQH
jgi:hypothetical protein